MPKAMEIAVEEGTLFSAVSCSTNLVLPALSHPGMGFNTQGSVTGTKVKEGMAGADRRERSLVALGPQPTFPVNDPRHGTWIPMSG